MQRRKKTKKRRLKSKYVSPFFKLAQDYIPPRTYQEDAIKRIGDEMLKALGMPMDFFNGGMRISPSSNEEKLAIEQAEKEKRSREVSEAIRKGTTSGNASA